MCAGTTAAPAGLYAGGDPLLQPGLPGGLHPRPHRHPPAQQCQPTQSGRRLPGED